MTLDQQLIQLESRIWELAAWCNRAERAIPAWTVRAPSGAERPLRPGERWDVLGWPALLVAVLGAPAPDGALLDLDLGGEGMVWLDGRPAGGLNPFHREFPAAGARRITVEVVPKGLFGAASPDPRIKTARLLIPDPEVRALRRDLLLALAAARELAGHEVQPHLVAAIAEVLSRVRFPSDTETVLARLDVLRRELAAQREAALALRSYGDEDLLWTIERIAASLPREPRSQVWARHSRISGRG